MRCRDADPLSLTLSAPLAVQLRRAARTDAAAELKRAVEIALTPEGSTRVALARNRSSRRRQQVPQAKVGVPADLDALGAGPKPDDQPEDVRIQLPAAFRDSRFRQLSVRSRYSTRGPRRSNRCSTSRDIQQVPGLAKIARGGHQDGRGTTRNQVSDQVARAYLACLRADAALETARRTWSYRKRC